MVEDKKVVPKRLLVNAASFLAVSFLLLMSFCFLGNIFFYSGGLSDCFLSSKEFVKLL